MTAECQLNLQLGKLTLKLVDEVFASLRVADLAVCKLLVCCLGEVDAAR